MFQIDFYYQWGRVKCQGLKNQKGQNERGEGERGRGAIFDPQLDIFYISFGLGIFRGGFLKMSRKTYWWRI